jgi:hypothetical protein
MSSINLPLTMSAHHVEDQNQPIPGVSVADNSDVERTTRRFAEALLTLNVSALTSVSAPDLTWTIPGHGRISGVHRGVAAVIAVSATIREFGISIAIKQILIGHHGVTALLHETGNQHRRSLDVRIALVLTIVGHEVTTVDGYISDVAAYDRYLD